MISFMSAGLRLLRCRRAYERIVFHILLPLIVAVLLVGVPSLLLTLFYYTQNGLSFSP